MFFKFEIQAYIFFLDKSVGGRHNFASGLGGYRPVIKITDNYLTLAVIRCEDADKLETGNYYNVRIELPIWKEAEEYLGVNFKNHFKKSSQIQLYEGSKIVAIGLVKRSEYS